MPPKTLAIYDPAMCCSTGICGPDVDSNLVRFSADLEWLSQQGVQVNRFNLAQQPGSFVANALVKDALETIGDGALPMLLIDGRTVMSGAYPSRDQLAGWFGLTADAPKCCPPEEAGCC